MGFVGFEIFIGYERAFRKHDVSVNAVTLFCMSRQAARILFFLLIAIKTCFLDFKFFIA